MSIKTGRAAGTARVRIDQAACISCGKCVQVCSGAPLYMEEGRVLVDQNRLFGCIGCGQCMAVCPQGCIEVYGRDLSPNDRIELAPPEERADERQLNGLLEARRSVRRYHDWPVDKEVVDRILAAASCAPMGIPPSDVRVRVFHGFEPVAQLSGDIEAFARKWVWLLEWPFIWLWRLVAGKATADFMEEFALPLVDHIAEQRENGRDLLLHGAPLALLFYGGAYNDPADATVAATYAMLAAETQGLGSCMIGTVAPLLARSRSLREKYGLPPDMKNGLLVVFGHPQVQYKRGIRRRFAEVRWE